MSLALRHNAFGAMTGWRTAIPRALALVLACVLALAVALPGPGLADDLAFHRGGHSPAIASLDSAPASPQADPGLAAHGHCGCHVAAALFETGPLLPAARPRPPFERTAASRPSIVPDRLPRPPRA